MAKNNNAGSQKQSIARKKGLWGALVRLRFNIQMALHGVMSNPLRSALTLLGIAVGVASVVSLMGIGEGARMSVMAQFESLGANVVIVEATDPAYYFDPLRADEFTERVTSIEMSTPVISGETVIRWRRLRDNVNVIGVNQNFPQVRDHDVIAGHFFNELHVEQRAQVVVLGYSIANALDYGRSPVGNTITIGSLDYTIIGVMAKKGDGQADDIDNKIIIPYTTAQKLLGTKVASQILCKTADNNGANLAMVQLGRIFRRELGLDDSKPISDYIQPPMIEGPWLPEEPWLPEGPVLPELPGGPSIIMPMPMVDDFEVVTDKISQSPDLSVGVEAADSPYKEPPTANTGTEMSFDPMRMVVVDSIDVMKPVPMPNDGNDNGNGGSTSITGDKLPITITSLNQLVDEADQANRVMTLLLGAIAAVSLLVGGLGIMNIMLVAVTERIGEIGVRRALGAKQGDLMTQFILEALFLSALGALLGVIIGVIVVAAAGRYGFAAIISVTAIEVAVAVALGCGLIFGVYPAFSASSISPVEALRRN